MTADVGVSIGLGTRALIGRSESVLLRLRY